MPFLARKFSRAKWSAVPGIAPGEIPADAISADLRTSSNSLSLWLCGEADDSALRGVVLALASGCDRLDRLDVVWIDQASIERERIALHQTRGRTPVVDMIDKHMDADELDLNRLGVIARLIHDALGAERCSRFSRQQVLDGILDGVERGVLDPAKLKPELFDAVRKEIERRAPPS